MKKTILVYTDGCYDLFHFGHFNGYKQARLFGTHLLTGINDDVSVKNHKNMPIFSNEERLEIISGMRCIDFIIHDSPYLIDYPLMLQFGVDILTHGDDVILNEDGVDIYEDAHKDGRFKLFKRTLGISTTEIVGRLLLRTGNFERHSFDRVEYLKGLEDFFRTDIQENLRSKFSPIPVLSVSQAREFDMHAELKKADQLGDLQMENLRLLKLNDLLWLQKTVEKRNNPFLTRIKMSVDLDAHLSNLKTSYNRKNLPDNCVIPENLRNTSFPSISELKTEETKLTGYKKKSTDVTKNPNDSTIENSNLSESGNITLSNSSLESDNKSGENQNLDGSRINCNSSYKVDNKSESNLNLGDQFTSPVVSEHCEEVSERIVYVDGTFDLYHAGHAALLKEAGLRCDKLILGLFSDKTIKKFTGEAPILQHIERKLLLFGNRYVDTILDDPPYILDINFVKQHQITEIVCRKDRFKMYEHLKNYTQIYICETKFDYLNVSVIASRILDNYKTYSKKIEKLLIT